MKPVRLTSIIRHDAPCEIRAAALDADGHPCRLFSQRWGGRDEPPRLGHVLTGRLRDFAPEQGGGFVELASGHRAFLAVKSLEGMTLGAEILIEVVAEKRAGKLARVRLTDLQVSQPDPFEQWCTDLPGDAALPIVEDAAHVEQAFEQALSSQLTLPKGGHLHIQHTRAITAIDIDTAGRISKGSAGARALSVNREAAILAARQIALRDIGGAVVIDCVGPLNKTAGQIVRDKFLAAFRRVSLRQIDALAPSRFGLMEIAIAWQSTPLADIVLDETGVSRPQTRLLNALRDADRQASAQATRSFRLDLSTADFQTYKAHQKLCDGALMSRFGGRVMIAKSEDERTQVRAQ